MTERYQGSGPVKTYQPPPPLPPIIKGSQPPNPRPPEDRDKPS